MVKTWWLVAALAACGKHEATPAKAGSDIAVPVVLAPDASTPKRKAPEPKERPVDAKARAAYRTGMRDGRKATDKKQYADAIAAFDRALAARPQDARALSERGFAKLLDGANLAGASRDLDDAALHTKDPKLLSMIWFNRGLVEEKRENPKNARVAYAIANVLRPTAAAKDKLAKLSGGECTAIVERTPARSELVTVPSADAADWPSLAAALQPPSEFESTAQLVERWFDNGKPPALPALVQADNNNFVRVTYLVSARGAKLHADAVSSGMAVGGRCSDSAEYDISAVVGHRALVAGKETESVNTDMCERENGDLDECDGTDHEGTPHGTACFDGTTTLRYAVVDLERGGVVLAGQQPDNAKTVWTLTEAGIVLAGDGCDRTEPW